MHHAGVNVYPAKAYQAIYEYVRNSNSIWKEPQFTYDIDHENDAKLGLDVWYF